MPRDLPSSPDRQSTASAQRALLHPLWLGSLVLLVLNDHVFKGAEILPELVTGKLSDIAGMIVAPALLATALGVHTRRGWWLAHAAVGIVFAAIKLSPVCASAWSQLMGAFGFAWSIVVDPTDLLVAIPALLLGGRVLWGALSTSRARLVRRSAEAAAAGIGLMCSVATSPAPGEPGEWQEWLPEIFADVWLHNGTGESQVIRVRALRPTVHLDCDAVAADPAGLLSESLFGDTQSWTVPSNANIAVRDTEMPSSNVCNAAWVEADAFAPAILFWRAASPSPDWIPGMGFSTHPGGIELSLDGDDVGHYDANSEIMFVRHERSEPIGECAAQDDAYRVDWGDEVIQGTFRITALTPGVDGCTAIDLEDVAGETAQTQRMYLCTPPLTLPFAIGDDVAVRMEYGVQSESVVIELAAPPVRRLVVSRGASAPVVAGLQIAVVPLYGCELAVDDCGTAALASSLTLGGGNFPTAQAMVGAEPVVLGGDDGTRVTVAVAHAQQREVLDTSCAAGPETLGDDLELAVVIEVPAE